MEETNLDTEWKLNIVYELMEKKSIHNRSNFLFDLETKVGNKLCELWTSAGRESMCDSENSNELVNPGTIEIRSN